MKREQPPVMDYRADVDGLRAIAVLAVVIFHFFPKSMPGGYVGVDVFFVISGFLVTGILDSQIRRGTFSFYQFYAKRVRRLFPALIAVIVAVLLAGSVLLMADEFSQLGKHIFSGAIFASNITLFLESGYFDRNVDLKPLLHLWSLAVEEQFYLVWPVLMYFASKGGRGRVRWTLGIVFILSLLLSVYLSRRFPSFSFYLLPTRLWELAAGGVLVLWQRDFALPQIRSNRVKSLMPLLGLAAFGYVFFVFNSTTPFPSYRALLPVLGTFVIIGVGTSARVNRFLSLKPIVYLGLISYPLYLWHWPLVSFASIVFTKSAIPPAILGLLFVLSFVLAALTYEFIEKPMKSLELTPRKVGGVVAVLFALGLTGLVIHFNHGFPGRYSDIERFRKSYFRFSSTEDTEVGALCSKTLFPIEMCALSDARKPPTVVLLGDSHANHLYPGLREVYSKRGENLALLAKSGTSPLVGVVSQRSQDTSLGEVFDYILNHPSVHTIVLGAFWGNYHEENGVQVSSILYKNRIADQATKFNGDQSRVLSEGLERTLKWARQAGKKVVFVYNIAPLPFDLETCMPRPLRSKIQECEFAFDPRRDPGSAYRAVVNRILDRFPEVVRFDPLPVLCPSGRCSVQRDGIVLYSDEYHLSEQGSIWALSGYSGESKSQMEKQP